MVVAGLLAAGCGSNKGWQDYSAHCASPRSGVDPATGRSFPDQKGTVDDEKNFLKLWINDLYLWYNEVPSTNPADYKTPIDYFNVLKTPLKTPGGKPKDPPQFHFTYPTDVWEQLVQSGTTGGYGMTWAFQSRSPPRSVIIAYTQPNSPAANAGIARGAQLTHIDGVAVLDGDANALNAGLLPATIGETHSFGFIPLGSTTETTVNMTSAVVTETPVQNVKSIVTATGKVGYMTFNDHIQPAEKELVDAFAQLKADGVSDLILDLRYNGGGILNIASEIAYMVAGPGPTSGNGFETTVFNDKHKGTDPVIDRPITPVPFYSTALGYSATAGTPLPTLNLRKLFVLVSPGTCSASESIINGLRGVDVTVAAIGNTTCGKPYGFYPQDNCGTTYFAIEFKGVNQKGFGDYPDGFIPAGTGDTGLPGCAASDDFTHALGDPAEGQLAAALAYRANGACPSGSRRAVSIAAPQATVAKDFWRQNRWYR
ncbi:MAG: S41 family peptidase [Myxococcales bacterium]|nr:peptidase [Myxococcales bacterium]